MQNLPLAIKEYLLSEDLIDAIYAQHKIELPDTDASGQEIRHAINGYALFQDRFDPKHAAIARYVGNGQWCGLKKKALKLENILPKDSRQAAFMDSLIQEDVLLNIAIGSAGTGKTTIALAYALSQFLNNKKPIFLTKPTTMVGEGRAFGPVPGDIDQKYAPYLASYEIVLKKIGGGANAQQFFATMKEKGQLQFFPIELARGCTFENCTLILDEAQNMSWHEMNTMISRMGENSKMVILGDLNQIDTGQFYKKTGLYNMLAAPPFQDSGISSAIELVTQYRSPITQLVTEINKWVSAQ
jgi:PhoH-like ATPase